MVGIIKREIINLFCLSVLPISNSCRILPLFTSAGITFLLLIVSNYHYFYRHVFLNQAFNDFISHSAFSLLYSYYSKISSSLNLTTLFIFNFLPIFITILQNDMQVIISNNYLSASILPFFIFLYIFLSIINYLTWLFLASAIVYVIVIF